MATSSFYENLVIETEEQMEALLRAFEEADKRGPEPMLVPSTAELIEEGDRWVREGGLDCYKTVPKKNDSGDPERKY